MILRAIKPIEELRVVLFELLEVSKVEVDGPFLIKPVVHV